MKTVKVTLRSREIQKLLEMAKSEEIVLQTPSGDEFMLSAIDDFAIEMAQQRQNKKLMVFWTNASVERGAKKASLSMR
jgi:hypothetical protein